MNINNMSQGRSTRCIWDGRPPTFNDGNPYFMGPYKPLRDWVEFPIPYGNVMVGISELLYRSWKSALLQHG